LPSSSTVVVKDGVVVAGGTVDSFGEEAVTFFEAEVPDPNFQVEFSTIVDTLDASESESSQRQAEIAELRESTEVALSELAEVVAAL